MSPSALWKVDVREALEAERQDILEKMLLGDGVLEGPFAPERKDKTDPEKHVYDWLGPSALVSFSPALSRRCANYALKLVSDPNHSIDKRVEAIEDFCCSPSTGHQEVMRARAKDNSP